MRFWLKNPIIVLYYFDDSRSISTTLLHVSTCVDSLQHWEMGVIREYQGGNHLPKVKLHVGDSWWNGTRPKMCKQQSFVKLAFTPNGFGIDRNQKKNVLSVWPSDDLDMTLRWPWGDTPSKAQHQFMPPFITIRYPYLCCHRGSSCGSTLLHFSNFVDSLQLWERGVIRGIPRS